MTVAELIKKLEEFDPDTEVKVGVYSGPTDIIEVSEQEIYRAVLSDRKGCWTYSRPTTLNYESKAVIMIDLEDTE